MSESKWTDPDGVQTKLTTFGDGRPLLRVGGVVALLTEQDATDLARTLLADQPSTPLPDATADGYDWHTDAAPDESSVATEAHGLVYGDRQGDYGHPREDFTRTAILWTGLLQHKLADGEYITPEDYARCMVAVKLSRDVHSPKRDNRVDGAGYFITLDRLETGK